MTRWERIDTVLDSRPHMSGPSLIRWARSHLSAKLKILKCPEFFPQKSIGVAILASLGPSSTSAPYCSPWRPHGDAAAWTDHHMERLWPARWATTPWRHLRLRHRHRRRRVWDLRLEERATWGGRRWKAEPATGGWAGGVRREVLPLVRLCPNGQPDTKYPAQRPDPNGETVRAWPICGPNLVSKWTERTQCESLVFVSSTACLKGHGCHIDGG
jgi:hypothetical protein